jgi:hypothetical protein
LPVNQPYDRAWWQSEVERGQRLMDPRYPTWQKNLDYHTGGVPESDAPSKEYVNVNTDFYETEQKLAQLFFETPELQFTAGHGFDAGAQGVVAFKNLMNAILGPDRVDALATMQGSIKRCVTTSGVGATLIGYQATLSEVENTPQPGSVLGLSQPVPVPIHERMFWEEISDKKFIVPADFHGNNFDKAPWLAMRFRMPFRSASRLFTLPPDFEGTSTQDDRLLESQPKQQESSGSAYVDGVIVWYQAHLYDDDVIHPELYRRHVLIEGVDAFADKLGPMGEVDPQWASPYQTILPNGRMSADSLIGNPIDVITLRSVPDTPFPPSDGQMRRGLVRELCLFRTQMVQERDINKPKFAYSVTKFPPDAIAKVEQALTGSLIGLPDECFVGDKVVGFTLLAQGSSPRQTYLANDYIERDLAKTSGIDAAGAGVDDGESEQTATKTAEIARARNVRLDAERKQAMRCYLRAVDKLAALVLRFYTDPVRVAELIGPEQSMAYMQWREAILQMGDPRPKFTAKPDSQVKLDAAAELKKWLNIYEFARKDPLSNGVAMLDKIYTLVGEDPRKFVAQEQPESKPEPSLGYSFKGEDLNPLMPQFPIVLEVLAQCGVQINPQTIQEAQDGALNAVLMQQAVPTDTGEKSATKKPAEHGGLADKVPPLSKHSVEQTGERSGPRVQ